MTLQVESRDPGLSRKGTPSSSSSSASVFSRMAQRRSVQISVTVALGVVFLAAVELLARSGVVSPLLLPAPSAVLNTLISGTSSGLYIEHIASTAGSAVGGFAIAVVVAFIISAILVSSPFIERVIYPYIVAFQTLPKVAIAPLIVIWLGFGSTSKVTIVAIVCFFPILVNTLQGLRIRDRNQYELMRTIGASRLQMLRFLRLPNALPYVFAGFHVGVVFSLIGAVVAEFVGSLSGLGYLLLIEQSAFNVPGVFAILVILMVIGIVLHLIMGFAERKIAFWTSDVSVTSA